MAGSSLRYSHRQQIGLVAGPALFITALLFVSAPGLSSSATAVLASTLWIACWWITEAVPIPITSLLPILLFPVLGVADVVDAAAPYADPIVFLFLGGFLVALAIERWDLHRRIALNVLIRTSDDAHRLILGFMLVTAFLSMWISNTATAMMMVPIGMAVIAQIQAFAEPGNRTDPSYSRPALEALEAGQAQRSDFGVALMLGIAYAASIGGIATLIGTPPNAILAGVARSALGIQLGFLQWMLFGVPTALLMLGGTWLVLIILLSPQTEINRASQQILREQVRSLGSLSTGERRVLFVFGIVAGGWILRPFVIEPLFPGVTDTTIALVGGLLVFLIPVDLKQGEFLLDWKYTTRVPWGVLILFGAGFSLASAFRRSGLDQWVAGNFAGLDTVSLVWVVLTVALVIVFLTEVTSNSATASLFIPVMATVGASLAGSPLVIMVTVSVAASLAFMLPVATPPNAIVFGSGYLTMPDMARIGLWLNLLGVAILTVMVYLWLPLVWGI